MKKAKAAGLVLVLLVGVPLVLAIGLVPFWILLAWTFGKISFEAAALLYLMIIAFTSAS